jgi:hypothetical protein
MKTPIQLAIEDLNAKKDDTPIGSSDYYDHGYLIAIETALSILEEIISEEKQVIQQAFEDGFNSGYAHSSLGQHAKDYTDNSEDYYNKTFNQ